MNDSTLAGKTILMSGGSRGIGLAIAQRAARDGANVAILAKTDQPHPRLEGTIHTAAADIEAAGGKALPILGDVRDEHDTDSTDVQRTADGWLCSGLLRIDEVRSAIGLPLPEGDYETLAGLLLSEFGRIPVEGDDITLPITSGREQSENAMTRLEPHIEVWRARIVTMDGRRIDRVALSTELPADDPASAEGAEGSGGPGGGQAGEIR